MKMAVDLGRDAMVDAGDEAEIVASKTWFLYMIRCRDGQLYTGISTDVARRLVQHQGGKGAKYLRGKGPLQLVFKKRIGGQSEALKIEARVKKMARKMKEEMIEQGVVLAE